MAKWDDALKSLGDEGTQIAQDFKTMAGQIKDDMSSFLQTEADRIKGFLSQFKDGDFDGDTLKTILNGEKNAVKVHAALIAAKVEDKAESTITDVLLKIVVAIIKLL